MRVTLVIAMTMVSLAMSGASTVGAQGVPAAPKLFAASADVKAMIAKVRAERKPDQANVSQPIVGLAAYHANLEYRAGGVSASASTHDKDAELFYVVEGAGTVVTGGKLQNERRTNPGNSTGTGIEGGTSRRIAVGDFILVPERTPHWFTKIDGALVVMSLHLPR